MSTVPIARWTTGDGKQPAGFTSSLSSTSSADSVYTRRVSVPLSLQSTTTLPAPAHPPYEQSPVSGLNGVRSPSNSSGDPRAEGKPNGKPYTVAHSNQRHTSSTLHVLAADLGVQLAIGLQKLQMQQNVPCYRTVASSKQAELLLNERRLTDTPGKAPVGLARLTQPRLKAADFSYKEVQRAFTAAVGDKADLGVVDAFLAMGASVDVSRRASTNMFKKMSNTDQEDQRCIVLQNAAREGSPEMVELLAAHATQRINLDDALLIAVAQQDLQKTRILLTTGLGADFSATHRPFIGAIRTGNVQLVSLLLAAPDASPTPSSGPQSHGTCDQCKADGLLEAVKLGSLPMVNVLLAADADTTSANARALRLAVSKSSVPMALAIAAARRPIAPGQLDEIITIAFTSAVSAMDRILLLQICLSAGATGSNCQSVLQQAVAHGILDVVSLLLRHGTSMNENGGNALCSAVEQEQRSIFDALMQAPANSETLGNALASTSKAKRLGVDFACQLLKRGASPDFNDGASLVLAVQESRLDILELLLDATRANLSKDKALATVLHLLRGDHRLTYLRVLLPAVPSQCQLNACLVTLVCERPRDHAAIRLLLDAGAMPDGEDGKAVRQTACAHDVEVLELLAVAVVDAEMIYSAAAEDVIKHTSWRYPEGFEALQWLLDHGTAPVMIEEAVVQAAINFDKDALGLLSDWILGKEIYTLAFAEIVGQGDEWLHSDNFAITQTLLERGACGEPVHSALPLAVEAYVSAYTSEAVMDTLLEHGASVNHLNGQALEVAVKAGHIGLLAKLCNAGASTSALSTALSSCFVHEHQPNVVVGLIEVLTNRTGHKADLNGTMPGLDPPIFLALQYYPQDNSIIKRMCELGCDVEVQCRYKIYGEEPLDRVVQRQRKDGDFFAEQAEYATDEVSKTRAIVQAHEQYSSAFSLAKRVLPPTHVDRLMLCYKISKFQARVQGDVERALMFATRAIEDAAVSGGCPGLVAGETLEQLRAHAQDLRKNCRHAIGPAPTQQPLHIRTCDCDECKTAARTDMPCQCPVCLQQASTCPCTECQAGSRALMLYKKGEVAAAAMARDGVCVEPPDSRPGESSMPAEKVTPLLFACCQVHDQAVSASVIDTLLMFKANANVTTSHSQTTPLLLAARFQRPDLVTALLKGKPDTSVKDKWLRSPLFYAARHGDQESVRVLLKTKPRVNDGSVHEAARTLRRDVLSQLLNAGHDPNFTSTKHDGLTPLGVLAMYCDGYSPPSTIEGCIEALLSSKCGLDPLKKWHGMTVLYLAMRNPMALDVTRAVFERALHEHMHNPANIIRIEGFNYSPTMYLEKGFFVGRLEDRRALIRFLKLHGAEDAYYADEHLNFQPPGACGLPPILEKAERQRKKHQQDLREVWQKHQQQMLTKEQLQDQYLQHQDERQQQHLRHQTEKSQQQEYQMIRGAETKLRVQQNENRQAVDHRQKLAELKAHETFQAVQHKQAIYRLDAIVEARKMAHTNQIKTRQEQSARVMADIKAKQEREAMQISARKNADSVRAAWEKTHAQVKQNKAAVWAAKQKQRAR